MPVETEILESIVHEVVETMTEEAEAMYDTDREAVDEYLQDPSVYREYLHHALEMRSIDEQTLDMASLEAMYRTRIEGGELPDEQRGFTRTPSARTPATP